MKILYAAQKYDYGDARRGFGFEHHNFYGVLERMCGEILYFDLGTETSERGRRGASQRLSEIAHQEKPDLLFSVMWENTVYEDTLRDISENSDTITLNWFCDDHWRFDEFSQRWAPCFNWVVTTSCNALARYELAGINNVIKSQWACNPKRYPKLDLPMIHDVTFVGLPHGRRREVITKLRDAGINAQAFGHGWDRGRLTHDEMIRVFNQSRINLNFAESSVMRPVHRVEQWWHHQAGRRLLRIPAGWRVDGLARRAIQTLFNRSSAVQANNPAQIKGRNFEVPSCGGFLLTNPAENIGDYFVPGRDIGVFQNDEQLIDQIRYYLSHENERANVADSGYRRAMAEHTYEQRFREIFDQIGLSKPIKLSNHVSKTEISHGRRDARSHLAAAS